MRSSGYLMLFISIVYRTLFHRSIARAKHNHGATDATRSATGVKPDLSHDTRVKCDFYRKLLHCGVSFEKAIQFLFLLLCLGVSHVSNL